MAITITSLLSSFHSKTTYKSDIRSVGFFLCCNDRSSVAVREIISVLVGGRDWPSSSIIGTPRSDYCAAISVQQRGATPLGRPPTGHTTGFLCQAFTVAFVPLGSSSGWPPDPSGDWSGEPREARTTACWFDAGHWLLRRNRPLPAAASVAARWRSVAGPGGWSDPTSPLAPAGLVGRGLV